MNVLFFGIFESIPLIYKDVFEMSDAMVAGLFFSVGLFVMFLTDVRLSSITIEHLQ